MYRYSGETQPDNWNLVKLWCCRCGAALITNRKELAEYDRMSKVVLCKRCEVPND